MGVYYKSTKNLESTVLLSLSTKLRKLYILTYPTLSNRPKSSSAKLPIPLLYGMIYRQLPHIDFSLSVRIENRCISWSATSGEFDLKFAFIIIRLGPKIEKNKELACRLYILDIIVDSNDHQLAFHVPLPVNPL